MSDEPGNEADLAEEQFEPTPADAAPPMSREVRFGLTMLGLLAALLATALYIKIGAPAFPHGAAVSQTPAPRPKRPRRQRCQPAPSGSWA